MEHDDIMGKTALSDADIKAIHAQVFQETVKDRFNTPVHFARAILAAADRRLTAEQGGAEPMAELIERKLAGEDTGAAIKARIEQYADNYVAWARFTDAGRIVLCDSDADGAFKVYRGRAALTTQPQAPATPPYKAQPPDYKVQPGTWELRAPDGTSWHESSPMKCLRAEQRDRIPASVAMARIFAAVDEETAPTAQPQAEPGWLPIKDAPKDGTEIFVWWAHPTRDSPGVAISHWLDNSKTNTPWAGWAFPSKGVVPGMFATHYRPLFSAPDPTTPTAPTEPT